MIIVSKYSFFIFILCGNTLCIILREITVKKIQYGDTTVQFNVSEVQIQKGKIENTKLIVKVPSVLCPFKTCLDNN